MFWFLPFSFVVFQDSISNGRRIDKFGDGSAVREFTYIDDIVHGVIAAVDRTVKKTDEDPMEYLKG